LFILIENVVKMKVNLFFSFFLTIAFFACTSIDAQNQRIGADEFEQKINTLKNEQLIDVRTPAEYSGGHLANATNINFNAPDFATAIQKLDRNKPVMVYCAAGGRSAKALKMLNDLKFKEVYELSVGFNGWSQMGKPSTK
jgi:thioredoxin 1